MNLRAVAAIALKDLVDAIRNRYLLVALLTPLSVALLLRVLTPGLNSLANPSLVVHDPGQSSLVTQLRALPQMKLVEVGSAGVVESEIEKNKAIGGLVVPINFDADVAAGKQPDVTVYLNNKKNGLEQASFRLLIERQVLALVKQSPPARVVWIDVGKEPDSQSGRGFNLTRMLLPLLIVLAFGMTGAFVVPLLLVEEKEKRTMDFLLTSPARLTEIVSGKAFTGIVYSVLIAGALLAINRQTVTNWPLTILTILVGMLLIVSIGLLMGSIFQTTMQVNTWASVVLLVLLAPSFKFPGSPALLEGAMRLVPTYYFVQALEASLNGSTSSWFWINLSVVSGCTIIAFVAGVWALRREQN
jgi:ABC-2 type transport system permease protein